MSAVLRVGISTCPNDTFAFHALLSGELEVDGLELRFTLADVQQLNEAMFAGELDVAKVSYYAALRMCERVRVLRAGSALGYGVGPVLIGRRNRGSARERVLAPGRDTTASLLLALYRPELCPPEHVVFSEILPALADARADLGVCIHEGRFTYAALGLDLVEDLGATWERDTGAPLPLGGIVCRADRAADAARLDAALALSLDLAHERPERALPTMRRYAQELDESALWKHVELYVGERTRDLGAEGRAALRALGERAAARGLAPRAARLILLGDAPSPEHPIRRLFHLSRPGAWPAGQGHAPPSLATEGYVHLSFAEQLEGTLRAHFGGLRAIELVELDPASLVEALRLQPSRGGEDFPHLYRALRASDVLQRRDLRAGESGEIELPADLRGIG